jgi:hypothetical protein
MLDEQPTSPLRTTREPFHAIPGDHGAMSVMGREGDTKHIWNKNDPVEVEAARKQFDHFRSKKYLAFHVKGKDGDKGEQMTEFDPNAERIIFTPPMQGG